MKRASFTTIKCLAHSAIYSSVLILLLIFSIRDQAAHIRGLSYSHPTACSTTLQNHFSSNDFDFLKGSGMEENFRHAYTITATTQNVLSQTVYDFYQYYLLTQKVAFYTRSPYLNSLSPLWNPSIPIAHRKLLI